MADEFLCTLILASEKASKIARLCRESEALFSLLIQEKGTKHNEVDFKTLADVFIQQVVTKEVECKCGQLADQVQGEENNQFTNTLGDTISVELGETSKQTADMLSKVLDGNQDAARLLSEAAHEELEFNLDSVVSKETLQRLSLSELDMNDIGIWIDPIDCTSQYIKGIEDVEPDPNGIFTEGLQCVMVLIGAYSLSTGIPVMGVINQPFYHITENRGKKGWRGRCVWGYSNNKVHTNNLPTVPDKTSKQSEKHIAVLSLHDPEAKSVMSQLSSTVDMILARGAGYKCLTVVDCLADLFVYTYDGCYKWDTCAPHAILLSSGGGLAVLEDAIRITDEQEPESSLLDALQSCQVIYTKSAKAVSNNWKANNGGLIVYNNSQRSLRALTNALQMFVKMQSK